MDLSRLGPNPTRNRLALGTAAPCVTRRAAAESNIGPLSTLRCRDHILLAPENKQ